MSDAKPAAQKQMHPDDVLIRRAENGYIIMRADKPVHVFETFHAVANHLRHVYGIEADPSDTSYERAYGAALGMHADEPAE